VIWHEAYSEKSRRVNADFLTQDAGANCVAGLLEKMLGADHTMKSFIASSAILC